MMNQRQTTPTLSQFFKDNNGLVVLWQSPNLPLYGWIIFKLLAFASAKGQLKSGFEQLSMVSLFVWGYLELTSGVNYFRRLLGLIVLVALTVGWFK